MNTLFYSFLIIAIWIVMMIVALFVCRALYQKYENWKRERKTIEALRRYEESERKIRESWKLPKD